MAKTLVGALALAALPSALAFRNTSPFFLFSTADLNLATTEGSIAESSSVTAAVLEALKKCPTHSYVVVEQQGVSSADFADSRNAPVLSEYMRGSHVEVRTTHANPEVVGQIDVAAIVDHLHQHCAPKHIQQGDEPWFSRHVSQGPSLEADNNMLERLISGKTKSQDYTVIYTTTPQTEARAKAQLQREQYTYENAFPNTVQMELKRDLSAHGKQANATEGGLFERYQYFTPGLFMGFAAIIPLFLILLVGVRALTSLEVSYYAFSKEMGPNAQKRQ